MEESKSVENSIETRKEKVKNKFLSWIKDNYDKIFLLIIIGAFIIRFLIFLKTKDQTLWWDEANYLATAKKWALGLPYVQDIWYYRRGFFLPLFSAIFYLLDIGEIGSRFSMVLFSTGIVFVSYFIIRDMFNKKLAILTSIALSVSWVISFFTGRILTDIPAAFFILLTLFLFWKGYVLKKGNKYIYFSGFFLAISILTRMQSLMLIIPFIILVFLKEKFKMIKNKQIWIALLIFIIVMIPLFFLFYQHYGNPITDILNHYFQINLSPEKIAPSTNSPMELKYSWTYFADLPYIMSNVFFWLLLIGLVLFFQDLVLGLDHLFKNEEIQKKLFILLWIVILFAIVGYLNQGNVEERYIIPGLPFLFLIAVVPIVKLSDFITKKFNIKEFSSMIIMIILVIILLFANIAGNSNYNWGNSLTDNKVSSFLEVKQGSLWIKENSQPEDIIISASQPQVVYYSERTTYTFPEIGKNESEFEENITKIKPKYLMLSIFEGHEPWMYEFPQKHNNSWVPVQAYQQEQNPVLVIYEYKKK